MPDPLNSPEINLAQSQLIKQNPHAQTISELNQLNTLLLAELDILTQKHESLLKQIDRMKKQEKKQKKQTIEKQQSASLDEQNLAKQHTSNSQPKQIDPQTKKRKQLKQIEKILTTKQKQLKTLQLRQSLLQLGSQLGAISQSRLQTLQKIFTHYCHYIFKSGRHVTFDRIEYQKSHLIMERFFAFVHDFHLNKYFDSIKGERQLVPKHQLILIFKKSSSNSRNLELTEFIACIQRLAVLRYDYEESYQQRKEKEQYERKKIKEINARRQKERERRKKEKQQYEERQKQQQLRKAAEEEQKRKQQLAASQQQQEGEGEQPKQQTKQERKQRKKRQKEKKKKKKSDKPQNQSQSAQIDKAKSQQSNQNQNNDQLLNELMQKDSSIQNPNEQFNHINKFKKSSSKKTILQSNDPNVEEIKRQHLLQLTKQEKVQLMYKEMEIDNFKVVEVKLREYQKPLFKEKAEERKNSIMLNSSSMSKIKQTDHNHQLKLNQLKTKIENRKKEKLKLNISRSITDEKYSQKKKDDYEKYLIKSIAMNNNDLDALQQRKNQQKKKNQPIKLSLNMLNQSSEGQLNALKLGYILKRYIHPEEDDALYLQEYGGLEKIRSSNSSYIEKTPRYSVDIKKRADQLEEQEKKNEEQKLERFALQMYKNQHYMKRFLQRKF